MTEHIWNVEPDYVQSASGNCLAVTPRDHPYRIGVEGTTQDEARRRFRYALGQWQELHLRREWDA